MDFWLSTETKFWFRQLASQNNIQKLSLLWSYVRGGTARGRIATDPTVSWLTPGQFWGTDTRRPTDTSASPREAGWEWRPRGEWEAEDLFACSDKFQLTLFPGMRTKPITGCRVSTTESGILASTTRATAWLTSVVGSLTREHCLVMADILTPENATLSSLLGNIDPFKICGMEDLTWLETLNLVNMFPKRLQVTLSSAPMSLVLMSTTRTVYWSVIKPRSQKLTKMLCIDSKLFTNKDKEKLDTSSTKGQDSVAVRRTASKLLEENNPCLKITKFNVNMY